MNAIQLSEELYLALEHSLHDNFTYLNCYEQFLSICVAPSVITVDIVCDSFSSGT